MICGKYTKNVYSTIPEHFRSLLSFVDRILIFGAKTRQEQNLKKKKCIFFFYASSQFKIKTPPVFTVINENIPQICMFNTGTKRPCVRNVQMHTEEATYSGVALRQSKEPCLGPTSSMLLRPKL